MKRTAHQSTLASRRTFLKQTASAAGLAGLLAGLPRGWVGGVYASTAPEVTSVKIGIIALTDCSPIVIAHEKGFFKQQGLQSTVTKGASWAAIRDALTTGELQAAHILFGMPFASTMGLMGAPKKPMIIPWILSRNGQGITLKSTLKGKVGADPKALRPFVEEARKAGQPMTFAMTFPPGTHAMWLRYYLAAGGIHPDRDVALTTVPPPQMVTNMRVGKMDGFCVGEPWNARALADGIGFTAIATQQLWKDHPEKACGFTEQFAEQNPKTVIALLKALHEASVWLDKLENRAEQSRIVAQASYINCPAELIRGRLLGEYDYGDGRKTQDPNYMIFHQRNCNYPQRKYGLWWLSQFRRWGMVDGPPDYEAVTRKVLRPDIYEAAMKEIGFAHGGADDSPETLFDGVKFDPASPEAYATSFAIHSCKGLSS